MATLSRFLPARFSRLWVSLFRIYLKRIVEKDFRCVEVSGALENRDGPILLLCNHSSWWDGFWMDHLNRTVLRKSMYMMMLETELRKRPFFRRVGAFSIQSGSRTAFESLNYAHELLSHDDNAVLIFPQGKIESARIERIRFQKGIYRLIERAEAKLRVVWAYCRTEYGAHRKPTLRIDYAEVPRAGLGERELEDRYNAWVAEILRKASVP